MQKYHPLVQTIFENYPYQGNIRFSTNPYFWCHHKDYPNPYIKSQEGGGLGITERNPDQVETVLPGVKRRLEHATGKIVYIGNGFSSLPIESAERFANGSVSVCSIIVDLFEYGPAIDDIVGITAQLERNNLPNHLRNYYENSRLLSKYLQQGKLKAINYRFGTSCVPEELQDAEIVVNCVGPNVSSIREQCLLLGEHGELWSSQRYGEIMAQLGETEIKDTFQLGDNRQYNIRHHTGSSSVICRVN